MKKPFSSQRLLAAASVGLMTTVGPALQAAVLDDVTTDLPNVSPGLTFQLPTFNAVSGSLSASDLNDFFEISGLLPGSSFSAFSTIVPGTSVSFTESFLDSSNVLLTAARTVTGSDSFLVPPDGIVRGHLIASFEGGGTATYTESFEGSVPESGTVAAAAAVGLAALLTARKKQTPPTAA